MKHKQNRVIKDIFGIEEGIANFDNSLSRYVKAGGDQVRDSEKKSDLLAILPDAIRKDLLWHAADGGSYAVFRDMILAQTQKIILNTKRGINAVDVPSRRATAVDEDNELTEEQIIMKLTTADEEYRDQLLEELMAIRSGRPAGPRGRMRERGRLPRRATPGAAAAGSERGPRRCPKCSETHASLKCPHPTVNCKHVGHSSANCPKAKARRPPGSIRTVEAENEPRLTMAVTEGGFAPPRRPARLRK